MREIFQAISSGRTILTPGNRLARCLRQAWGLNKRNAGFAVWSSADIVPWSAWLRRCWKGLLFSGKPAPALLTPRQEKLLWENIIQASPQGGHLLRVDAAAGEAIEAWELLHAWKIPRYDSRFQSADDPAAFQEWANTFESICRERAWLDPARLADFLRSEGELQWSGNPPPAIGLAGFDEPTPQQTALFATLDTVRLGDERSPGRAVLVSLPDSQSEIEAAAQWARDRLDRNPQARIGIVVPRLAQVRSTLERMFADLPAHISLGPPLADRPVVHAALLVLETIQPRVAASTLTNLLLSPWIAGAEAERSARARFDAVLRRNGSAEYTIARLADHAACPTLMAALLRNSEGERPTLLPSAWSRSFTEVLRKFGWPGDRTLASNEYQAVDAWKDALSEFASLDVVSSPLSGAAALSLLRRIAADTVFQPEDRGYPVQILGMVEAASEDFDHLRVLGLDDDTWPRASSPNPFLPLALQREHNVPRSSPARELEWSRRLTQRLLSAAPEIVVSWPETQGERDLTPSPLVADLRRIAPPPRRTRATVPLTLEAVADNNAPRLPDGAQPYGGTRAIKLQADCPFRAFAEMRLSARPLEEPSIGFNHRLRGTLLHVALQHCWAELESHAALAAASGWQTAEVIERAVVRALHEKTGRPGSPFEERLQGIEHRRLATLLVDWLDIERKRPAPFRVLTQEQQRTITLGGLSFHARIDRIDQLDSGALVLIDYKSTAPPLSALDGDRPEEPQLPLYATSMPEGVSAVAFAQVRTGDSFFRGYGSEPPALPDLKSIDMKQRLAQWSGVLETLAVSFRDGNATVDPKTSDTCEFCHLAGLCRIGEHR